LGPWDPPTLIPTSRTRIILSCTTPNIRLLAAYRAHPGACGTCTGWWGHRAKTDTPCCLVSHCSFCWGGTSHKQMNRYMYGTLDDMTES
jgi:hypothetical protein